MTHRKFARAFRGLAVCSASALAGCSWFGIGGPTQRTLTVLDHRAECRGEAVGACLLTTSTSAGRTADLYYAYIEGFNFEWGNVYQLVVNEYPIKNPPADGAGLRVVLNHIVSKSRVSAGTEFDIFLSGEALPPAQIAPGVYRLLNDGTFSCQPSADCTALIGALQGNHRLKIRFAHADVQGDPLRVVRWEECPAVDVSLELYPSSTGW